jgi:hypothetical protein
MTSGLHPFQFQADGDKEQVSSRALMGTFLEERKKRGKRIKATVTFHISTFDADIFNCK